MKALTPLHWQLHAPSFTLQHSTRPLNSTLPISNIQFHKQRRLQLSVCHFYSQSKREPSEKLPADDERWRTVVVGLTSLGVMLMLMMGVDEHRALAFGPEGPLVEEFWDNVRRYALYALTVSTGALYTVLQPVLELLKNPITAIFVLLIVVGSFYVLSQVLSAMVGVTEFSYDYGY